MLTIANAVGYAHETATCTYDAPALLSVQSAAMPYVRGSPAGPSAASWVSPVSSERFGVAANTGVRAFDGLGASDLRAAAQVADRNGLTQVGRALQKNSGRERKVFNGFSGGTAAARNEQGLRVLDEILSDPSGRTEVLNQVTNIWDSTGRGVRFGNDGSFMGVLEPLG